MKRSNKSLRGQMVLMLVISLVMSVVTIAPVGAAPLAVGDVLGQAEGESTGEGAEQAPTTEPAPTSAPTTTAAPTTTLPPEPVGPGPTTVSNIVYVDLDRDGTRDGNEPTLAGVTVNLADTNGTVFASKRTNANGQYTFGPSSGVVPGVEYVVTFDASTTSSAVPGGFSGRSLITTRTGVKVQRSNDSGFAIPFDLELSTTADASSINADARTIRFNLTVVNQGSTVDSFEIADYFNFQNSGQWEDFNAGLNPGTSNYSWDASDPQRPVVRVNGTLPTGASFTVPIVMRWQSTLPAGTSDLINWAEISNFGLRGSTSASGAIADRDSIPDRNPTNDGAGQDDRSGTSLGLFDLALDMSLDDGSNLRAVVPDSRVTFDITVHNQGLLSASNITITDYLPAEGMALSDSDWTERQDGTASITLPGTLAPGQSRTVQITFRIGGEAAGQINNRAEISRAVAVDGSGNVNSGISDRDSTFDNVASNDAQPSGPNASTDDAINNEGGDEDDHDIASVRVGFFDLALAVTVAGGFEIGEVPIGNAVVFDITVSNEGEVPATNVGIRNYLPRSGLVLVDPDWTDNGDGTASLNRLIEGPIPAGRSITVPITFIVDASAAGTIYNWAEISSADVDDDTTTRAPEDIDSEPGNNPRYNIEPSIEERLANIEAAGGSTDEDDLPELSPEERAPTERDEDDHDFAGIRIDDPVLDLAIQIRLDEDTDEDELSIDDEVTFVITVLNQGTAFAEDVAVVDYLPTHGLFLADDKWRDTGEGTATRVLEDPLAPGGSIELEVDFVVGAGAVNTITNSVEVANAVAVDFFGTEIFDVDGESLVDIDSLPIGELPGNQPGSEDDHSSAAIHFEPAPVYDLALFSELTNGSERAVFAPGDSVSHTLTIFNEGEVGVEDIELTMRLPEGFSIMSREWQRNGDGTATMVAPGPISAGQSVNIDVGFQANADASGNSDHVIWIAGAVLLDEKGERLADLDAAALADFDVADNETSVELNAIPTLAFSGAEAETGQLFGWALLAAAAFVALMLAAYSNRQPASAGVRLGNAGPASSRFGPVA